MNTDMCCFVNQKLTRNRVQFINKDICGYVNKKINKKLGIIY